MLSVLHECDGCGAPEERVFTDTWTGKELCPSCLHKIIGRVQMSPATDPAGDNLPELLKELI